MPYRKIFLSYSRIDASEFALNLAKDLRHAGANIWLDQLNIEPGLLWDIEIEKALGECDCLLYILTEKSALSNHVMDEVAYAIEENKKVIPLLLNPCNIPFRIRRLQHINFIDSYAVGLENLKKVLDISSENRSSEKGNLPQTTPAEQKLPLNIRDYVGEWKVEDEGKPEFTPSGVLTIIRPDPTTIKLYGEFAIEFPKKYDEPYLERLYGFISCASCPFEKVMTFKDYIRVGTMEEKTSGGKTTLSSSAGKDVNGLYTFQIIDKNKIELNIHRVKPIQTNHLEVNPFTYTLTFIKDDDY